MASPPGGRKKWKVVELSNDYLQILILPEIGGKVWAAIEKSTGKSFIYFNQVVKFRDVGMRGPWTSGGMEANYGIMGHTPNCFSPGRLLARRNPDGSASCIIGVLDLLTSSTWRLEINLPANQAVFTTRVALAQRLGNRAALLHLDERGIKAAGNLQFVNPGTCYIDHDGKAFDWPINRAKAGISRGTSRTISGATSRITSWAGSPSSSAATGTRTTSAWPLLRRR